jgi:hypothetical protein
MGRFASTVPYYRRFRPPYPPAFFAGSAFALKKTVSVRVRHTISVDTLIGRLFSMSNTSPEMLGPRAGRVGAALRAALSPFTGRGGSIVEVVDAKAAIFARLARGTRR